MMSKSVFRSPEGKAEVHSEYGKILENWPMEHSRKVVPIEINQAGAGASTVMTHIIECGRKDAPILILLHGSSSNSAAWMGDVELWAGSFSVYAIDIPGQPGLSSDFSFAPGSEEFRLWLQNTIEYCRGSEKVYIVGQSLGGFAALQYAIMFPEKVRALSLLTASGLAPSRLSFIFKALPLMLFGERGAKKLDRLIRYNTDTGEEAAEFGRLVSKNYIPMTAPIPVFTDEELQKLQMPVQYFGGDHDVLLDTEKSAERLRTFVSGAQINLLPETGHVIIGRTVEIRDFLSAAG